MDRLLWGVTYGGVRRSTGPDCPRGEPDPSVRTRAKQKQKPARSVTNSGLGPVLGSGGLGHAPRRPGPIGWGIPGGRLPLSGRGRSRLRSAAGLRGRRSLCRRARLGADPLSVRELASPPLSGPAPGRRVLWLGRGGETHGRASASGLSGPRPARSVRSSVFPLQLLEVAGVEPRPRQVPEDLGILGLPQHQCPHASSDPVQIWRGGRAVFLI